MQIGKSVTYGNGVFVAVAENSNNITTSLNGITWISSTLPVSIAWASVAYGNSIFVAVAANTNLSAKINVVYLLPSPNYTPSNLTNNVLATSSTSNSYYYGNSGVSVD